MNELKENVIVQKKKEENVISIMEQTMYVGYKEEKDTKTDKIEHIHRSHNMATCLICQTNH